LARLDRAAGLGVSLRISANLLDLMTAADAESMNASQSASRVPRSGLPFAGGEIKGVSLRISANVLDLMAEV
jgi:hypothetical protein